jgi:hypothetical protein
VRWLVLLAIGVGGPAWIVLRDWAPVSAAQREQAKVIGAARVACPGGCRVHALRRAPGGWVVRVTGERRSACLLVDPDRVAVRAGRGLVGASRVPCPAPPATG